MDGMRLVASVRYQWLLLSWPLIEKLVKTGCTRFGGVRDYEVLTTLQSNYLG